MIFSFPYMEEGADYHSSIMVVTDLKTKRREAETEKEDSVKEGL
jgi:hypothetical protein